ncbi:MAG: ATP-binding protein [Acidobacteriota bacterium]
MTVSRQWRRLQVLSLASGGVSAVVALVLTWTVPGPIAGSPALRWTLTTLILLSWIGCHLAAREQLTDRLRTFANLVGAVREEDFSLRASGSEGGDPSAEMASELNALSADLRGRRLAKKETEALLGKVLGEIDAGIFAFDEDRRLQLVNRRGAEWLGKDPADLHGSSARMLGLEACLAGDTPRVLELALPAATGRHEIRRATFRESGHPHELLVVTDLSRALAAEERLAWKRLVQVLRHEINNSLAPIRSMAATLSSKLDRAPRPDDLDDDLAEGLDVIHSRSDALGRLMAAYAQLTRLPAPQLREVDVAELVQRVATMEERRPVTIEPGPTVTLEADPDQLEQALINLLRNATDAVLSTEADGVVRMGWTEAHAETGLLIFWIEDDGPGLADSENLFVPFFTTKPGGSGIGLVLARQVAEAHGGRLELTNRSDATGARVTLAVPA